MMSSTKRNKSELERFLRMKQTKRVVSSEASSVEVKTITSLPTFSTMWKSAFMISCRRWLFPAFTAGTTWTCSTGTIIISQDMECLLISTKTKSKSKRKSGSREEIKSSQISLNTARGQTKEVRRTINSWPLKKTFSSRQTESRERLSSYWDLSRRRSQRCWLMEHWTSGWRSLSLAMWMSTGATRRLFKCLFAFSKPVCTNALRKLSTFSQSTRLYSPSSSIFKLLVEINQRKL